MGGAAGREGVAGGAGVVGGGGEGAAVGLAENELELTLGVGEGLRELLRYRGEGRGVRGWVALAVGVTEEHT